MPLPALRTDFCLSGSGHSTAAFHHKQEYAYPLQHEGTIARSVNTGPVDLSKTKTGSLIKQTMASTASQPRFYFPSLIPLS